MWIALSNGTTQNKLLDGWDPDEKKAPKRQSAEPEPPKTKRQKKSSKSDKLLKEEATDESAEEEDVPKKSKPSARRAKAPKSDEEDDATKNGGTENDGDQKEPVEDPMDHEPSEPKATKVSEDVAEEDEYSDVIDEPPPPKRRKGQKKEPTAKAPKQPKPSSKSAPASEDPLDAEIKKLQSQLTKCGVRKLWHNELKQYGDDAKAKIRHLKKMLTDIGMEGRFSEAKAREIKEARELLADAEAAQEMNRLWGTGTGGRASRSKSKPVKVDESEGSDGEEEKEETDEENTFAARRRRAQAMKATLTEGDANGSHLCLLLYDDGTRLFRHAPTLLMRAMPRIHLYDVMMHYHLAQRTNQITQTGYNS
jgi:hypothetical protein